VDKLELNLIVGSEKMPEKTLIRRRASKPFPRSPDMDGFIPEVMVPVLYERWKSKRWGEPIVLSGGTLSITCDMIAEVGFQPLSKVYGVRRAKLFMDIAKRESVFI
jgi:hypothetical protein